MIKKSTDIRGFCNFDGLYEHCVAQAEDGNVFVELGSLWGRSSLKMAELIRDSGKDIKFYVVDYWDLRGITEKTWSNEDKQWAKYIGTQDLHDENIDLCYETFLRSVFELNLQNYIFPIKLSSNKAHVLFKDQSIDFLFIDADHSYEGVKKDIEFWYPKVRGIISGHDYDWPGVRKAVDEFFKDRTIYNFNTSWIVEK